MGFGSPTGSTSLLIWRFPETGVPLSIHDHPFLIGFSILNHPEGSPMTMETPICFVTPQWLNLLSQGCLHSLMIEYPTGLSRDPASLKVKAGGATGERPRPVVFFSEKQLEDGDRSVQNAGLTWIDNWPYINEGFSDLMGIYEESDCSIWKNPVLSAHHLNYHRSVP